MTRGRKNIRQSDRAASRANTARLVRKAGTLLLVFAILATVVVGALNGVLQIRKWFLTSPTFAMEEFAFEGLARAREAELLSMSELRKGDNIFEVELEAVVALMRQHPWVRDVTVERELPRKLAIQVFENEPVALVELGGLYYLDVDGHPFKKVAPGEQVDFPIIGGPPREAFGENVEEYEALFREALRASEAFRQSGLERRAALSQIDVDREDGVTLFLGSGALAVKLGRGEYEAKFTKLGAILAELDRRGERAEIVRLESRGSTPGRVAVQTAQRDAPP